MRETPTAAGWITERWGSRAILAALLLLLAWIPIPLGSNRPLSWAWLEFASYALLGVRCLLPLNEESRNLLRQWRTPLVLLGLWLLYVLIQSLPLPAGWIQTLSPARYELNVFTLGPAGYLSLSVDSGATQTELLKYGAYVSLLLLVLMTVTNRERLLLSVTVIFIVGAAESLYGILERFAVLGGGVAGNVNGIVTKAATGTFVNRNHYASFLAMTMPLGISHILFLGHQGGRGAAKGMKSKAAALADRMMGQSTLVIAGLGAMSLALLLSTSRGAVFALVTALCVGFAVALWARGREAPERRLLPVLALLVAIAVWYGGAGISARLGLGTLLADERLLQWGMSFRMIAAAPAFGFGAGTYVTVFPAYINNAVRPLTYDHAHSDFIETMAEQGFVGVALLAAAVSWMLIRMIKAYAERRDALMLSVLFAVLVGATAALVHAALDFPFRIPANAAYFFVLLGLGLQATVLPGRRSVAAIEKTRKNAAHR